MKDEAKDLEMVTEGFSIANNQDDERSSCTRSRGIV